MEDWPVAKSARHLPVKQATRRFESCPASQFVAEYLEWLQSGLISRTREFDSRLRNQDRALQRKLELQRQVRAGVV